MILVQLTIPANAMILVTAIPSIPAKDDLRHLCEQGLIRTVPQHGHRDVAVVLTDRGRDLLESHRRDRDGGHDHRQEFYAEPGQKPQYTNAERSRIRSSWIRAHTAEAYSRIA